MLSILYCRKTTDGGGGGAGWQLALGRGSRGLRCKKGWFEESRGLARERGHEGDEGKLSGGKESGGEFGTTLEGKSSLKARLEKTA